MKSLEYVKQFRDDAVRAYEQVKENPETYEEYTRQYAKKIAEDAEKWYQEMTEKEKTQE